MGKRNCEKQKDGITDNESIFPFPLTEEGIQIRDGRQSREQPERLALLTPQEITPVKSHNTSQSRDGADDSPLLYKYGLKSGT